MGKIFAGLGIVLLTMSAHVKGQITYDTLQICSAIGLALIGVGADSKRS